MPTRPEHPPTAERGHSEALDARTMTLRRRSRRTAALGALLCTVLALSGCVGQQRVNDARSIDQLITGLPGVNREKSDVRFNSGIDSGSSLQVDLAFDATATPEQTQQAVAQVQQAIDDSSLHDVMYGSLSVELGDVDSTMRFSLPLEVDEAGMRELVQTMSGRPEARVDLSRLHSSRYRSDRPVADFSQTLRADTLGQAVPQLTSTFSALQLQHVDVRDAAITVMRPGYETYQQEGLIADIRADEPGLWNDGYVQLFGDLDAVLEGLPAGIVRRPSCTLTSGQASKPATGQTTEPATECRFEFYSSDGQTGVRGLDADEFWQQTVAAIEQVFAKHGGAYTLDATVEGRSYPMQSSGGSASAPESASPSPR